MIRLILLVLVLLPGLAMAAPVRVQSGEHDGFTRLVFDYGQIVDWRMGRTADGYALRVPTPPVYDFTEVFDLVGKSRLAAIWADPQTGDLRIGIACPCHAIPFEFRPGIVVIDLRDGPPPAGSSFEMTLDGQTAPAQLAHDPPRPRLRPEPAPAYDWLAPAVAGLKHPLPSQSGTTPLLSIEADPTLQPLRTALLRQLSRGAAQGVIDMTLPRGKTAEAQVPGNAAVEIHLGDATEMAAQISETGAPLSADGQSCPPSEALDLAAWGDSRPVPEQLAASIQGLVGEFDKPDAAVVLQAVRLRLFLGFGAEARQLMAAFPATLADQPMLRSLSYLVDGQQATPQAFDNLTACDSNAALWAMLSEPAPEPGTALNRQAIILAFSALPIHLRKWLGPEVAQGFLNLDDHESARAIRDAILRAPGDPGIGSDLLQAKMEMTSGDAALAEFRLSDMLADPGPQATEALVPYVEARFVQDLPIAPNLVPALEALAQERFGTPELPSIERALIIAQASSGDFTAAFQNPALQADTEKEVWQILSRMGVDEAVLQFAILAEDQPRPDLGAPTTESLARRLLDMGFAQEAGRWLDQLASPDPLLAARLALAQGRPEGAIHLLLGSDQPEAQTIRATALQELGDGAAAADAFAAAGATTDTIGALISANDWNAIANSASGPWSAAARTTLDPPLTATAGPLAQGQTLIETSAATRAALTALLAAVPRQ